MDMSSLLKDKVAIVTGAARKRGIGRAIAKLFIDHGAKVAILDIEKDELSATVDSLGPNAMGVLCDLRSPEQCEAAVDEVVKTFGHVDCLVNNAGMTQRKKFLEITPEDYLRINDIVLGATFRMSQLVLPHMPRHAGATIVCVSSVSALQGGGVFGGSHYCAAKSGVLGLVRSMAKEFGPEGIRINAIAPGLTLTDFSRGENPDENKHEAAKAFPLRRVGLPEDSAYACLYLASEMSSYVTGVTLDVNGGLFIHA